MIDSLTICTVSYNSASLLDLNMTLTRELNSSANFHWLVVDNAGDFQARPLSDTQDVQLVQGDPCLNQGKLRGSYHHAQALNKAMRLVSTRYLMVIDPDFFILRKDWVQDVLGHMSLKGLWFWGAPYYPDLNWKRRYFPTVSCMLIDLQQVPITRLDFTPELDEYQIISAYSVSTLLGVLLGIIPMEVCHVERHIIFEIALVCLRNRLLVKPLSTMFPKRFYPNTNISRDTGFKIQNEFGRNGSRLETLQPSYVNDLFTTKDKYWMNVIARMFQIFIPEDLSIYPKKRDYATTNRFKDFGLPDVRGEFGWEEYFWKGHPFAMHMKGGTRKYEDVGYEKLQNLLKQLAGNSL